MRVTSNMQFEFAQDSILLELWMIRHGYKFTYGHAWRSDEEQERLFQEQLSNVKTRGAHGNRLAKDYNIWVVGTLTNDKTLLAPIGNFWKNLNPKNIWGGDFKVGGDGNKGQWDTGHFERRIG